MMTAINVEIERVLERVYFGTPFEETGLCKLGRILAVPDKALQDIAYYEALAKGEAKGKPNKFDHWELYASDLAAVIACAYVYKNQYRFLWENFSLEKNFASTLLKLLQKHKAVTKDGKVSKNFIGFLYMLLEPSDFSLAPVYFIRIGYHHYRIRRLPDWKLIYAKNPGFEDIEKFPRRVHPLVYAYIQRFFKCGQNEFACIAQTMIDGLRKCTGV